MIRLRALIWFLRLLVRVLGFLGCYRLCLRVARVFLVQLRRHELAKVTEQRQLREET